MDGALFSALSQTHSKEQYPVTSRKTICGAYSIPIWRDIRWRTALQFGTLALMSTSGKDAEHVYLDYKTRGDVEQAIDAFKNIIEADHSYMQDEKSLEAWTFICLLALQWYYDLSDRLKRAELSNKFAPMDMVRSLSRVRTVRVDKKWIPAEVMKKDRQLIEAAGLDITPDSGIL